ncbi:MAG: methyltransferase domain-containing protein [Candidatus Helarchaeales archaeon]
MNSFTPQVDKDHYYFGYDSLERFISYYYQVEFTLNTKPRSVLEIGIGNKFVSNYLKARNVNVQTCDIDPAFEPDKVGDIRELPFGDKEFDTVLACEVLEHIPFEDVPVALKELKRVANKYVVISIPYSSFYVENVLKISSSILDKKIDIKLQFPTPFKTIDINKGNKEHYWEMGRRGYPKRKIKALLKKYFIIVRETQPIFNLVHYFFLLKV